MTHDPLCACVNEVSPLEFCQSHDWCRCDCDLIAKVRADEAQKTEERVTERLYESWDADLSHQRYH